MLRRLCCSAGTWVPTCRALVLAAAASDVVHSRRRQQFLEELPILHPVSNQTLNEQSTREASLYGMAGYAPKEALHVRTTLGNRGDAGSRSQCNARCFRFRETTPSCEGSRAPLARNDRQSRADEAARGEPVASHLEVRLFTRSPADAVVSPRVIGKRARPRRSTATAVCFGTTVSSIAISARFREGQQLKETSSAYKDTGDVYFWHQAPEKSPIVSCAVQQAFGESCCLPQTSKHVAAGEGF
ncbi:hypothetical protein MRX96_016612 [Rhipicephalus microplus]